MTNPQLAEIEERLASYYEAQIQARQRSRSVGRKVLLVVGALSVLGFFLCAGLMPALFTSGGGGNPEASSASAFSCGVESLGAGSPNLQPGKLTAEQVQNAKTMITVGRNMGVPARGWVVAVATSLQESKLRNYGHLGARNDHDSLGLFQQRPSQGWGTPAQVTDPEYASRKFYAKLLTIPNWQQKRVTEAAQAVQRSAFPNAYQKWESLATHLVVQIVGGEQKTATASPPGAPTPSGSPSPGQATPSDPVAALRQCAAPTEASTSGWRVPVVGRTSSGFRTADRPNHQGMDIAAPRDTTIRAAAAGIVVTSTCNASTGNCDVDGSLKVKGCGWYVEIDHGAGLLSRYCHMVAQPVVKVGQRVVAGDPLGAVGSSGNSTAEHLHFEVHMGGEAVDPAPFMAAHGAPLDRR